MTRYMTITKYLAKSACHFGMSGHHNTGPLRKKEDRSVFFNLTLKVAPPRNRSARNKFRGGDFLF